MALIVSVETPAKVENEAAVPASVRTVMEPHVRVTQANASVQRTAANGPNVKTAHVEHSVNALMIAKKTAVFAHVLVVLKTSVHVVPLASVPAETVPASHNN